MGQFAMQPDIGGLARPAQRPDMQRIERERRRLETTLRQLDRQIMGQRSQDRRAGSMTDQTDTLLRRDELKDQLLRAGTALRPVRNMTTPDEVMAKRADLQRQGLQQAQGDLSRASAPIAPDRVAQVRQATEAQAVAAARARQQPGGNVPALELLPSNLNRAASETLARDQIGAIDGAVRRVDAFERFGFTPEQARERTGEANAAAARRNAERADAQSALAETFTKRDMEEAEAAERADRIQQAQEAARIAEIQARTRAFDSVGAPEQLTPEQTIQQEILAEDLRRKRIENDASEMLLRQSGGGGLGSTPGSLDSPEAQALLAASDQQEVFGGIGSDVVANVGTALSRATQGGFNPFESSQNVTALALAMKQLESLPPELRQTEAQNLLTSLSSVLSRNPDGSVGDFIGAAAGELFTLEGLGSVLSGGEMGGGGFLERLEGNRVMRARAQDTIRRLREMAGIEPTQGAPG